VRAAADADQLAAQARCAVGSLPLPSIDAVACSVPVASRDRRRQHVPPRVHPWALRAFPSVPTRSSRRSSINSTPSRSTGWL